MNPNHFWAPWEETASSFDDVLRFVSKVHDIWITKRAKQFAWRGLVDASWAMHSSLYRRLMWTTPATLPDEAALQEEEEKILVNVHRWGLHWAEGTRLPILHQLALLQHYGAPTRLIDITCAHRRIVNTDSSAS
jgi:hypothetical protein